MTPPDAVEVESHEASSGRNPRGAESPQRVPRRYVGPSPEAPPPKHARAKKPDPAWDKLLLVVGAIVAVAALLVVPGILNGGGKNPIAAAAEATRNAPGVRVAFRMSAQGPTPMTMTGTGVMNGETQRASLEFKAGAPSAGGEFTMSEVIDHLDLYMQMPQLTERLGGGKQWLLIKAESFLGDLYQGGGGIGAGMSASPAEQLEQLESSSDQVRVVGHGHVGGADTTHYSAVIDLQRVLDELRDRAPELAELAEGTLQDAAGSETVDVWVDGGGLVRRMQSTMAMGPLGGFQMTMDFSDYGIHPAIEVPPESEVFDATPMLDRLLSAAGDES